MNVKTDFMRLVPLLLVIILSYSSHIHAGSFFEAPEDAKDITCNVIVTDSTIGKANDFTVADYAECVGPQEIFNAGDQQYKFVLTDSSSVSIELTSLEGATLELFLLSNTVDTANQDCPDTCIARTSDGTDLEIRLGPGTYWLSVDGNLGPDLSLEGEGLYELVVRCEKDYTDIDCGEVVNGSTVGRVSNYGVLDYAGCFDAVVNTYGAGELLYRFEVDEPKTVDITLEKLDEMGLHLFLLSNAVDIIDGSSCPGLCVGISDTGSTVERIHGILPVGVYWILVDGDLIAGVPDILIEGTFNLSISCSRDFGSMVCQQPVVGSTEGRISYRSAADYAACGPMAGTDGGDLTYEFELVVPDEVTFTLQPQGTDLDLYLLSSTEIDEGVFQPNACLAKSDTGAMAEAIKMQLAAGVYYVVVDGPAGQEGGFTLFPSCALLPVELVQFSGTPTTDGIKLSWETASEINFEGFYIQRSQDAEYWNTQDWMDAKGGPDKYSVYHYLDPQPLTGMNYYRLNSVDVDGSTEYSSIVTIKYDRTGEVRVFPTLTSEQVTIAGTDQANLPTYEVRSSLGQLILSGRIESSRHTLDLSTLQQGVFYLSVVNGSSVKTFPVQKM
ncbi:MAG: T9SS type A sorting domain-containing protein [Saprospiraceae bacterium]|nr:T9SS type A sorting domain-containing protein [Saprospiraceae bacterium]